MLGRYLDLLARAEEWDAIDRVVEARDWITQYTLDDTGARCLLGHVGNEGGEIDDREDYRLMSLANRFGWNTVGRRFDSLVKRFGMERVVRALKLRAGRHARVPLTASVQELVEVAL